MRCDICGQKDCCGSELQDEIDGLKKEVERLNSLLSEKEEEHRLELLEVQEMLQ